MPVITPEHLNTYRNGLKCFIPGRALARILHPNVVRVMNFFRANETVYMVMAFEQGPDASGADPAPARPQGPRW